MCGEMVIHEKVFFYYTLQDFFPLIAVSILHSARQSFFFSFLLLQCYNVGLSL